MIVYVTAEFIAHNLTLLRVDILVTADMHRPKSAQRNLNIYDPIKFLMASSNASLVMDNKPINKVTFPRFCFVVLRLHENITLTEITYFSKV